MGVIIELSILIVGLVAVLVWVYNNYIYLSDKTARKIEVFGYILLFSVIIWEMVIKNILSADFYDSNWLYLDQKLFALYIMLEDILTESAYDATQIWEIFSLEDSEYVKKQLLTIDVIEAILTVLSTVCIAVGRFQDLRKGAKKEIKKDSISMKLKEVIEKMFKRKKENYREKYKPDNWIYIVITIISATIRCVPISCGSANLDDAFNDLAVGAMASTVVAWLIDVATCSRKNRELIEKERMVFAEYCSAVNDIGFFTANRCQKFSQPTDEFALDVWLSKLRDSANYPPNISPAVTMERSYFHISAYVRNVKSTLVSLRQQYCMLVEADIIDTDDFRQHAALQIHICDEVCDAIELIKHDRNAVTEDFNKKLLQLVENARGFYPDSIATSFSCGGKG